MKRLVFVAILLGAAALGAQELVTLTTPITPPTLSAYHVERLTLDVDAGRISVQLKGTNGEALSKVYDSTTTPTGATLLHALNVGNFSVNSLLKAVYTRLLTDGVLVGTVSGIPQ